MTEPHRACPAFAPIPPQHNHHRGTCSVRQNNRVAANLIKTLYFRLHYTSNFDHTFTACRLPLAKHDRRGACRHASGAARQQKTESPRVLCPMSGQNPKMAYQIIGWRIKLSWLATKASFTVASCRKHVHLIAYAPSCRCMDTGGCAVIGRLDGDLVSQIKGLGPGRAFFL